MIKVHFGKAWGFAKVFLYIDNQLLLVVQKCFTPLY
jgi:hypothetical protein